VKNPPLTVQEAPAKTAATSASSRRDSLLGAASGVGVIVTLGVGATTVVGEGVTVTVSLGAATVAGGGVIVTVGVGACVTVSVTATGLDHHTTRWRVAAANLCQALTAGAGRWCSL
jgi:hypothetical protein